MENGKNITISDVANALNISKTTVSRAISGKGRIGAQTRQRVLDYIEKNDYRPSLVAQGLAMSKTLNIGVAMPPRYELMDLPFFQNCMYGIHEMATSLGYDILLTFCDNMDISHLERIVNYHKVDGIILMRSYTEDREIELLQKKKIPFVVIGSTNYSDVYQIDHDHLEACRELVSILLMKQLTRLALIGGDDRLVVTQNRFKGFRKAYEDLKMNYDDKLIYMNYDKAPMIEKAMDDILQKRVDCIVCMDDSICTQVLKDCHKRGILIPEQMRLVSFYNSTVLENNLPPVTSLSFGVRDLGMQAARMLIDQMEDRETAKKVLLGYEVVLKESTK